MNSPQPHPQPPVTTPLPPRSSQVKPTLLPPFESPILNPSSTSTSLWPHHVNPYPSIVNQIGALSEIMINPQPAARRCRVIAVDGSDSSAVTYMIEHLRHHLPSTTRLQVCISGLMSLPSEPQSFDLGEFIQQIQQWNAMLHRTAARSSTDSACINFSEGQFRNNNLARSIPGANYALIVPFSPLNAISRAASSGSSENATPSADDLWYRLANFWRGSTRPDILIDIKEYEECFQHREVLRIFNQNIRAVVATTERKRGRPMFLDNQLRRIVFEVSEWLRED